MIVQVIFNYTLLHSPYIGLKVAIDLPAPVNMVT